MPSMQSIALKPKKPWQLAQCSPGLNVDQWFSTFLILGPFNTVPHTVMTPVIELFSLLLHNSNFVTVMIPNVNTFRGRGGPKGS